MVRIAIVEDDIDAQKLLKQFLTDYSAANQREIEISIYNDAVSFLREYKALFDIVFMDINMPNMNGMEAAETLRKIDETVILVFVTDMSQYAVRGYSVSALDYILKPIKYDVICSVMSKAQNIIERRKNNDVIIKAGGIAKRVSITSITYVEVFRHRLTYHTLDGDVDGWGTLDNLKQSLPAGEFSRCNLGYLVGLRHVKSIEGDEVVVGKTRLKISRTRKKEFLADVAAYLGDSYRGE